ncbi:protein SGT1 homolog [Ptychodera flava]|uniref:protein SGT1 homolog n=1 Tax=Ptychodera flava TaxID=63121 RepID=UPI00396A6F3B
MAELFSKANEAFVDENYGEAIKLYSQAIEQDAEKTEYFLKRAQTYIKLEEYTNAVTDTEKAVELDPKNSKCFLRKGIALFHLEKFQDAKTAFVEGQQLDSSESSFKTWIRKCEAELDLEQMEESSSQTTGEPVVGVASSSGEVKTTATESAAAPDSTEPSTSTAAKASETIAQAQPPSAPFQKIRHDWYQTETHVVVTIMIKNAKSDQVQVDFTDKTVSVTVKLPSDSDYNLELDLAHSIVPDKSVTKVLGSKIELKLKKVEGIRWSLLEGTDDLPKAAAKSSASKPDEVHKYPSSSQHSKDWDKLARDVDEEEKDSKQEGDAALNQLFQQIYADGTDEVKRAMNKSFVESGGTVLSTNWKEIGDKKTEVKPPDGMEWKTYDK